MNTFIRIYVFLSCLAFLLVLNIHISLIIALLASLILCVYSFTEKKIYLGVIHLITFTSVILALVLSMSKIAQLSLAKDLNTEVYWIINESVIELLAALAFFSLITTLTVAKELKKHLTIKELKLLLFFNLLIVGGVIVYALLIDMKVFKPLINSLITQDIAKSLITQLFIILHLVPQIDLFLIGCCGYGLALFLLAIKVFKEIEYAQSL